MSEQIKTFDTYLQHIFNYMDSVMNYGMQGKAGAVYPVIIRRWANNDLTYQYPSTYFHNLKVVNGLYLSTEKKTDRITFLKLLVDKLIAADIDVHLYHLGMYILYPYPGSIKQQEDEDLLGKRRLHYMNMLPKYELKSNDDFLSSVWSDLIERRFPEVGEEIVRVPLLSEVRMLFTTEQFGSYTGRTYYDADWVEPIYGRHLEVKKWVGEKDPMTAEPKKEGMLEGTITLGHEGSGSGLRHFVVGEAIHSGSYIEVKFGDGWIPGRYEWSYNQEDPIQIHSGRFECFYIREGSLVRVRK